MRQLVERALGEAAERGEVARAQLLNAAAMGRAAHDGIADAERIHDVERKKRDVRRLEHVAAGVEDEIRRRVGRGARCVLPEPRQQRVVELNARHRMDVARDLAKTIDAAAAHRHRVVLGARHGGSRHAKEEARIDAVVAGLDAIAGAHAAGGPMARRIAALAPAQNVDDAADDADRIVACRGFQPGGAGDRASLDAFAATGAGVDHGVDAALQGGLEGLGHGRTVIALSLTPATAGIQMACPVRQNWVPASWGRAGYGR